MFTIHEGEVIFKEKYGSSPKTRLYVRPPEQGNLVMIDEDKFGSFNDLFARIFLPQGYPDSVSKDYINYQIWDTAQAFCSTITGTLATQEVLRGVGVGDTNATPLAATITWVLKDGCGHLGRIFFAYSHGCHLDAYSKKWRLYADTLNDAAMCMEIALPYFKGFTKLILCASTVMKSIVGVAGSASRMALTQHHAIRGNMADVSAKDAAQETAVNLIASICAVFIITIFGNSIIIFTVMMVLHIIFNYFAVRAVCLRTLNEPRFLQLIDAYLKEEVISTPCEINKNEPIVFYQVGAYLLDLKLSGFRIKIGHSMNKVIKSNPKAFYNKNVQEVYEKRDYILMPDVTKRKIFVILKDTATTNDTLCAYFHAVLLAIMTCVINDHPLAVYKRFTNTSRPFPNICTTVQTAEWSRDESPDPASQFKQNPSIELMIYLDKIVQKEWLRVKNGLNQTGWDLSKHLLIVDEWRLCSAKVLTQAISMDNVRSTESLHNTISKVITFDDLVEAFPVDDEILKDTYTIEPDAPGTTERSSKTKV